MIYDLAAVISMYALLQDDLLMAVQKVGSSK